MTAFLRTGKTSLVLVDGVPRWILTTRDDLDAALAEASDAFGEALASDGSVKRVGKSPAGILLKYTVSRATGGAQ